MAERCRHVVAYEIDPLVFRDLKRRLGDWTNVTLVQADFLRCSLPNEPYSVCASLPFNITADVVAKLTTGVDPPNDAYLVIQREAVRRFMVSGQRRFTLISCLLYPRWKVHLLGHIPATAFRPQPAVSAALIHFRLRPQSLVTARDQALFRDLVTQGFVGGSSVGDALRPVFTSRQLRRIAKDLKLKLDGVPSAVRPAQWVALMRFVAEHPQEVKLASIAGAFARLENRHRRLRKSHRTRR
ncbi:MAG: hypothetical protein F4Y02_18040 [Chloroflexi bacterium]|nr:hypothetical protein [Chloroflexota bacterium]